MKKVLINITSYNRKEKLLNLIEQVKDYDYIVWDDNSDFSLDCSQFKKFNKNYGKKLAWQKFDKIFTELKTMNHEYFIFLPDDVVLCDEFVVKALSYWKEIKDDKKICLSFSSVERTKTPNWTGYKSHKVGNVIKTQWNDLMFICDKRFLNEVRLIPKNPDRWLNNPRISSGVGRQISIDLHNRGFNMYNTSIDLVKHIGNEDSKMNPEERKIVKL